MFLQSSTQEYPVKAKAGTGIVADLCNPVIVQRAVIAIVNPAGSTKIHAKPRPFRPNEVIISRRISAQTTRR